MLDGRVKTLHPAIHGGLLARRDLPEHMKALAEHHIEPIDLVAVNLYPFEETAAQPGAQSRRMSSSRSTLAARRCFAQRQKTLRRLRRSSTRPTMDECSRPSRPGTMIWISAVFSLRRFSRTPPPTTPQSLTGSGANALKSFRSGSPSPSSARLSSGTVRIPGQSGPSSSTSSTTTTESPRWRRKGWKGAFASTISLDLEGRASSASRPVSGRNVLRNRQAHNALRAGDGHHRTRCVQESPRVRPTFGVWLGDLIHRSGSTTRRREAISESLRRVHRRSQVQRRQAFEILGRKKNLRVLEGQARWRETSTRLQASQVRGVSWRRSAQRSHGMAREEDVVTKRQPTDTELTDSSSVRLARGRKA